jgi:hypothetical protein
MKSLFCHSERRLPKRRIPDPGFFVAALLRMTMVLVVLVLCVAHSVYAQVSGNDWCQGKELTKTPFAINLSGTGEHLIVAAVANQPTQVCNYIFDLGGTTPTIEFDQGTQTTNPCDTSVTPLTGAMTASKQVTGPFDYLTVLAGFQLCAKLGGTSPTAVGHFSYVQKGN